MSVDPGYRHQPKHAASGDVIAIRATELKWYAIAPAARPTPAGIVADARAFVVAEGEGGGLLVDGDRGFVILHRCGDSFYFLLVSLWRGSNELWEAVYFRDADRTAFARFDPAYPTVTAPRPTFCVWELGVVTHEAKAWTRFLSSPRGDAELTAWRNDRYDGAV